MGTVLLKIRLNVILRAKLSLNNDIVDARPKQIHVYANLFKMLAKSTKRPFVSIVILFTILVLNELFVLFVNRVVGKMHEFVLLVYLLGIGFACKSGKTFLEDINLQRFVASDHNIDTEVKLVTVDQQRVRDVLADHRGLVHINVIDIINQIDAFTLARVCWFYYPHIFL